MVCVYGVAMLAQNTNQIGKQTKKIKTKTGRGWCDLVVIVLRNHISDAENI